MEIVIITYLEDLELCKLQLKSIEKYVESTTINIVINEDDTDYFINELTPIITTIKRHKIRCWDKTQIASMPKKSDTIYDNNIKSSMTWEESIQQLPYGLTASYGWVTQQILKLLFATKLNADYIVCDTKDIFVKPTTLKMLNTKQAKDFKDRDAHMSLYKHPFQKKFYDKIEILFGNIIDRDTINTYLTPQVINHKVVNKILSKFNTVDNFIEWFMSFKFQSEFILHDYVVKHMNIPEKDRQPKNFITYNTAIPSTSNIIKLQRFNYKNDNWNKIEIFINEK